MQDMWRSVHRGWLLLLKAPGPLLVAGVVWTLLNVITSWLLVGPALFGLFAIALKAHQDQEAEVADAFAAFDEVTSPLVGGFLFLLPFSLWSLLEQLGDVPAALTIVLALHFAVFVHVFAVQADRSAGLVDSVRGAVRLAEGSGAAGGRFSETGRHLAFGMAVLVALWLARVLSAPFGGFPVLWVFVGPLAACVLTAWYAHRAYPTEEDAASEAETEEEPAPRKKRARRRPPSARRRTTDED